VPRLPRPDDLLSLRVPTDLRLSPDGSRVAFVVRSSAPDNDGYHMALWLAPSDGSSPARQLTLGATRDTAPRWSPDGRWLAFLSDREAVLRAGGARGEERERRPPRGALRDAVGRDLPSGTMQVWLLPMEGGEAAQLTDLPDDVGELAWSPDSRHLCVVSASRTERRDASRERSNEPRRDVRLIDELDYQLNGAGFTYDRRPKLWVVDVEDGSARRITSGSSADEQPAWSPDGQRIAFVSNRGPRRDLVWRSDLYLVDPAGGPVMRVTGGRHRVFHSPAWSPDGRSIAAIGHRIPAMGMSREDVWVFPPEPLADGRELSGHSDLEVGASMNSDLFGTGSPRLAWDGDGETVLFGAPTDGSYELWRVRVADGRVERLTEGRHMLSRADAVPVAGGMRIAAVLLSATEPPDVVSFEVPAPGGRSARPRTRDHMRRLSALMAEAWAGIDLVEPVERWHESDGRRIQGWFHAAPARDGRPAPVVVEIHGGPATCYGWSLMWEWQLLVASGVSVYACNPRGSQGYGQDFTFANFRDWGDGPMADISRGLDSLAGEGLIDPERLGVTGGSYGGYLTAWMIAHTGRFAAAVACRGVYDMTSEMLSGDLGGPLFGQLEFGVSPWEDPDLYRQASPMTYAARIRTPLLIQHAEQDLRCPITQAEELFSVLRSLRRPVRLMRTPAESHELTRSGTPFRRVENLERIRDWFTHFLVAGARGLPRW
jgi:dipeptidyl aminopeptidase/acylaminoacyl peptidase